MRDNVVKVDKNTQKAYKEIYRIIQHSEQEIQNKIPNKFIELITTAMSEEYEPNINYDISINNQELMPETYTIMAIIYRDFICSKEKRNILLKREFEKIARIEKEKQDKYDSNNLFKHNKKQEEIIENRLPMEIKKESFFHKILKKIRMIFKR